jgi:Kef-type K+ transport system membrane component KefB
MASYDNVQRRIVEAQMEPIQLAAILVSAALLASMVSVEVGVSVALVELALGILLGNTFDLDANASWLVLIAGFASVVLTFLAGAEVDPDDFRERFGASIAIGVVSFAGPFVAAALVALGPLGWTREASLIAGTALSTTSLAVVYAVLVETGLNTVRVGKLIMSACFVTDMCTVIALSVIFITAAGRACAPRTAAGAIGDSHRRDELVSPCRPWAWQG